MPCLAGINTNTSAEQLFELYEGPGFIVVVEFPLFENTWVTTAWYSAA
jgi:hypothetical protein